MFKHLKQWIYTLCHALKKTRTMPYFERLHWIYEHLLEHNPSQIDFSMRGVLDDVAVNRYSIPFSFDADELKANGFTNGYEVMNRIYEKIRIAGLTDLAIREAIEQELSYDFLHLQFNTPPLSGQENDVRSVTHHFMVFFCCTDSEDINDFRVLYAQDHFFDYIASLLKATEVNLDKPETLEQETAFALFEKVQQATCEFLGLENTATFFPNTSEESLLVEKTVEAYFEFLKELNPLLDEKQLQKMAKKLYTYFVKQQEMDTGNLIEWISSNYWMSDWKFDAEDIHDGIESLIHEDFQMNYPAETYSHDLFPFIQTELRLRNVCLMNYNSWADHYYFMVVDNDKAHYLQEQSGLLGIDLKIVV